MRGRKKSIELSSTSAKKTLVRTAETYRPGSSIPPLDEIFYLDFDSKDEEGNFCAPEGELRSTVLSSTTSHHLIVARGAASVSRGYAVTGGGTGTSSVVHGATGMAGVDKTMALIALGHDETIRKHFRDGILYLTLGADASVESITRGLSQIKKCTGPRDSAAAVREQTDPAEAIEDTAFWFQNRRNLFLIDDIWPTKNRDQGFIPELRNILRGSPDSRIVLTTRYRRSGSLIGSQVDFGARDPFGPISMSIFMLKATAGCRRDVSKAIQSVAAVEGILKLCAGLPIALALTGSAIAAEVGLGHDFEFAGKCNASFNRYGSCNQAELKVS